MHEHSGELRKHGVRIRLQEQPFRILALLLDRPGEIVSREEIRAKLWPENTFVDFDNAISSAVRKLREALSDSADTPRFIETLSRRGYRFIGPIRASIASAEADTNQSSRNRGRSAHYWASKLVAVAAPQTDGCATGAFAPHRRCRIRDAAEFLSRWQSNRVRVGPDRSGE